MGMYCLFEKKGISCSLKLHKNHEILGTAYKPCMVQSIKLGLCHRIYANSYTHVCYCVCYFKELKEFLY